MKKSFLFLVSIHQKKSFFSTSPLAQLHLFRKNEKKKKMATKKRGFNANFPNNNSSVVNSGNGFESVPDHKGQEEAVEEQQMNYSVQTINGRFLVKIHKSENTPFMLMREVAIDDQYLIDVKKMSEILKSPFTKAEKVEKYGTNHVYEKKTHFFNTQPCVFECEISNIMLKVDSMHVRGKPQRVLRMHLKPSRPITTQVQQVLLRIRNSMKFEDNAIVLENFEENLKSENSDNMQALKCSYFNQRQIDVTETNEATFNNVLQILASRYSTFVEQSYSLDSIKPLIVRFLISFSVVEDQGAQYFNTSIKLDPECHFWEEIQSQLKTSK